MNVKFEITTILIDHSNKYSFVSSSHYVTFCSLYFKDISTRYGFSHAFASVTISATAQVLTKIRVTIKVIKVLYISQY